jgi:hypothetical protein
MLKDSFNPMLSIQMMPASNPKLDDLLLKSRLDSSQLNQMNIELELVTIALAALTQIERVAMRQIAEDLQLESIVGDWLDEWPLVGVASPLENRVSSHKQLDVEQLRAVVSIVNHVAQTHQALVRQTIYHWQQTIRAAQLPLQSPPLAEYINNFITIYQTRLGRDKIPSFESLSTAALTLSIELLFYGSPNGHQRLWGALLQRSRSGNRPEI